MTGSIDMLPDSLMYTSVYNFVISHDSSGYKQMI
jgi:hypothetical protein